MPNVSRPVLSLGSKTTVAAELRERGTTRRRRRGKRTVPSSAMSAVTFTRRRIGLATNANRDAHQKFEELCPTVCEPDLFVI